jgi:hypothetical protein
MCFHFQNVKGFVGSSMLSQVKSLTNSPYLNDHGFKMGFGMSFHFQNVVLFQNVKGFVGSSVLSQIKSLYSPYINERGFKMGFGMSFHFQNVVLF